MRLLIPMLAANVRISFKKHPLFRQKGTIGPKKVQNILKKDAMFFQKN